MSSAHTLALLCQSIYNPSGEFDRIYSNDAVTVGHVVVDGLDVFVFRGTADIDDVLLDIDAINLIHVPLVGHVGDGFHEGISDIYDQINLRAEQTVIITGHSKGGSNAEIFARYCLLRGVTVLDLTVFEPPRTGMQDFYDGLRGCKRITAYCNGLDPVPLVPIGHDQLPLIHIDMKPHGLFEELNPIDYHDITLCIEGT